MARSNGLLRTIVAALFVLALVQPALSAPTKGKSKAASRKSSKLTKTKGKGQAAAAAGKSRKGSGSSGGKGSTTNNDASTPSSNNNCFGSNTNDTAINLAFFYGGVGTVVNLCPGATIKLYNPIFFTQNNQVLQTLGRPSGSSRATLSVEGSTLSTAVVGNCDFCTGIRLSDVIINGNRPRLGRIDAGDGGAALIEIGGNFAQGQLVENVWSYNPRGWSALHTAEGNDGNGNPSCSGLTIRNNQIGPSGSSPNQGPQFKRDLENYRMYNRASAKIRAALGVKPPGEWADGISLACANSIVSGNVITDATDGGIVIFAAQGSLITGNKIIAQNSNLLGGINMVDMGPWKGDYKGVVVTGNQIVTDGAMIKIGIAMGTMVWGSYNNTDFQTFNGKVAGNILSSTSAAGGIFGYGIASAGMRTTTTVGNTFTGARFGGAKSAACIPDPYAPPNPQAAIYDPQTTTGGLFQPGTASKTIVFLICLSPVGAEGSTPFTRRDTIVERERSLEVAEPIDHLVSRALAEDSDSDLYSKVLARAIAEDDSEGEDAFPAPKPTGAVAFERPSYIPRAAAAPEASR